MAVDVKNGDGHGWVGRSIRRFEDPALVAGNGRFTGDLPAARWVRFVRSSVAAGRIKSSWRTAFHSMVRSRWSLEASKHDRLLGA